MVGDTRTRAFLGALAAAVCAAALGACGSSGGSGSTTAAAAGTSSAENGHTSSSGSSLSVEGTPRFAVPSKSEPVRSGTVQISYRNITIQPDTLRVRVGTTVRWTDHDPVEHNVTSVSGPQRLRSGELHEGQSYSVQLTRPGTIHYECTNHPATMNGTIEVLR